MNVALWIVQGLLAALFLFAGVMKLLPIELPQGPVEFPRWFLTFIGVVETAGGLGLILPGLLGIAPWLTPLAAAGLVIIMIGAVVVSIMIGPVLTAAIPLLVGLLAAFVAYGRWRLGPLRGKEARLGGARYAR
jgi:hypothetical protein